MPLFLPFTSHFFLMVREGLRELKKSYYHLRFGPLYYEKGAKLSLQEEEGSEERGSRICYSPFCDLLLPLNIVSPEGRDHSLLPKV